MGAPDTASGGGTLRLTDQSICALGEERCAQRRYSSTRRRTRTATSRRAERLTRAAAADGADLVVLPEKFNVLGSPRGLPRERRDARRPDDRLGPRHRARELGIDLVAGSFVERREGSDKLGNTTVHVGPDGELRGVYRKIHMFDVTVEGKEYRESASQEAGDEIVTSRGRGRAAGADRLLRPALPRAVPDPRAARRSRAHAARRPSPSARAPRTGTPSCVRGRSRTRRSWWPPTRSAPTRPTTRASAAPRSWIPGATSSRGPPDEECFVAADLDLARQDEVRESLPESGQPRAVRLPLARGGAGLMATAPRAGARRQAPPDPRRRRHRVRPPGLSPLPRLRRGGRGRGRLRARLPLLRLQGADPQRALPRALAGHARRDRARSTAARRCPPATSSTWSPASSSTPTATSRT